MRLLLRCQAICLTYPTNLISAFPETCGQPSPESLKDALTLLDNTKMWSFNNSNTERAQLDVKYSALNQNDSDVSAKSNGGTVGNEQFDNVNFDYDDFSEEDDEVNLIHK